MRHARIRRTSPRSLADALTALVTAQVWLGRGVDRELVRTAIEVGTRPHRPPSRDRTSMGSCSSPHRRPGRGSFAGCIARGRRDGPGDEEAVALLRAELGWVAYLEGDWESSLDHLSAAIRMGSGHPGRLGMLALVEAGLGQVDASRTHATQGLEASARSGSLDAEIFALSASGRSNARSGTRPTRTRHLERAWRLHQRRRCGRARDVPVRVGLPRRRCSSSARTAAADEWRPGWRSEEARWTDRGRWRSRNAPGRRSRPPTRPRRGVRRRWTGRSCTINGSRCRSSSARTLMILGSIRRRDKQKRPAREALQEAIAIFERLPRRPGSSGPRRSSAGSADAGRPATS